MGRLLILMVVLGGCVPAEEWDDDGSGVVFSPPPGEVERGAPIAVDNRSGNDALCWVNDLEPVVVRSGFASEIIPEMRSMHVSVRCDAATLSLSGEVVTAQSREVLREAEWVSPL